MLDFIAATKNPTWRAIAKHIGVGSVNSVKSHIEALERKGFLSRFGGEYTVLKKG